jgi:hypothetical protein
LLFSIALTLVQGCSEPASVVPCTGQPLFGRPDEKTGLSTAECKPSCECGDTPWTAPAYGEADFARALGWTLLEPLAPLTADPYAAEAPSADGPEVVCGVLPDAPGSHDYRLVTYDSTAKAEAAGAFVTHFGSCGLCSPLVDLEVYMRILDLTAPVRQCGLDHLGDQAGNIACLQALGFDLPCAQIWTYNTLHTRAKCLAPCMSALDAAYNLPDGSLNECLSCDEEQSGAVFKAVAGRTRRNTGIASAICRPCSEARALVHDYL